jgi:hypothetical protein
MTDYKVAKTTTNVRLMAIYNDPKFGKEAAAYEAKVAQFLLARGLISTPELFFTGSRKIIEALEEQPLLSELDKLLIEYDITDDEFWAFLDLNQAPVFDTPIEIDLKEGDYINLRIYPWAKKKHLMEAWTAIEEVLQTRKGYVQKLRGSDRPQLLYAVMKAKKTYKFAEIAEQINSNNLKGYILPKGGKHDWDEAGLKDYFHRNKKYVVKQPDK